MKVKLSIQTITYVLAILSLGYLLAFIASLILYTLYTSYNVDTYAANGTFQLYNPLRRLSEGQALGYDFPFFHGIGVLLLHLPLFTIFGENLFAAEVTKIATSVIVFIFTTYIFFYAFLKNHYHAIISTAAMTLLAGFCIDVIYPGNSLLGLRSASPVLVAAALLWKSSGRLTYRKISILKKDLLIITLLAISFLCGTEQGIAAVLAFIILRTMQLIRLKESPVYIVAKMFMLLFLMSLIIILLSAILSKGNPIQPLYYALITVPSEQGWYFGSSPNKSITWSNILTEMLSWRLRYMHLIIIISAFLVLIAFRFKFLSKNQTDSIVFMFLTGIIVFAASAVGGYYAPNAQLVPLVRFAGLILIALIVFVFLNKSHAVTFIRKKGFVKYTFLTIFACVVLFYSLHAAQSTINYVKSLAHDDITHIISEARHSRYRNDYEVSSGPWQTRLDAFLPYISDSPNIWSTYTSSYDSSVGQYNASPGGEDYIIHALGKKRRAEYTNRFMDASPEYVITLKPTYFPYEEWLWSRHWDFYKILISNYTIFKENDSHILWKKLTDSASEEKSPWTTIKKGQDGLYSIRSKNESRSSLYEIKVAYSSRSGILPVLNRSTRYLLNIPGTSVMRYPISLPDSENEWIFPLAVGPGESVSLESEVLGLSPGKHLELSSVEYRLIRISNDNMLLLEDNHCSIAYSTRKATSSCPASTLD